MNIHLIELEQFRNYEHERFVLDPSVNLICGENGQGKTNLLEAAAACSTMRLFRTAQKKEGLRFGTDHALIRADLRRRGAISRLNCAFRGSKPWKFTGTACGRSGRLMYRDF